MTTSTENSDNTYANATELKSSILTPETRTAFRNLLILVIALALMIISNNIFVPILNMEITVLQQHRPLAWCLSFLFTFGLVFLAHEARRSARTSFESRITTSRSDFRRYCLGRNKIVEGNFYTEFEKSRQDNLNAIKTEIREQIGQQENQIQETNKRINDIHENINNIDISRKANEESIARLRNPKDSDYGSSEKKRKETDRNIQSLNNAIASMNTKIKKLEAKLSKEKYNLGEYHRARDTAVKKLEDSESHENKAQERTIEHVNDVLTTALEKTKSELGNQLGETQKVAIELVNVEGLVSENDSLIEVQENAKKLHSRATTHIMFALSGLAIILLILPLGMKIPGIDKDNLEDYAKRNVTFCNLAENIIGFTRFNQSSFCRLAKDDNELTLAESIETISESLETSTLKFQQSMMHVVSNTSRIMPQTVVFNDVVQGPGPLPLLPSETGSLKFSLPVFNQGAWEPDTSRNEELRQSIRSAIESVNTCGGGLIYLVGYADSNVEFPPESDHCNGRLEEMTLKGANEATNLCLANKRAKSVEKIVSTERDALEATDVQIGSRQWQFNCDEQSCTTDHRLMNHHAQLFDFGDDRSGAMNRRVDLHLIQDSPCTPPTSNSNHRVVVNSADPEINVVPVIDTATNELMLDKSSLDFKTQESNALTQGKPD